MSQRRRLGDRELAFAVCLGAGFMALLDVSIVNVALPSIESSLAAAPSALQWIVAGYTLAFGLVLVPAGRFGDSFGRRRMFLVGLTIFVLASAACGLVTSAPALAAVRLVQGVGAGTLSPQVVGFIQQLFSGRERARAFGMYGAVIGISTASGPVLGGLLLGLFGEAEGWRAVFLVNVPVGAILLPMAWRLLPRHTAANTPAPQTGEQTGEPAPTGQAPGTGREGPTATRGAAARLDVVGLVLIGAAVLCLMLPFILSTGEGAGAVWWLLALGAVLVAAFAAWERLFEARGGEAVLPRALARTASFTFGAGIGWAYFAGFTSIFLVSTLYLQNGLGLTPLQAGLVQTPFALVGGASAMLGARLVVRIGRWCVVLGTVAMLLALTAVDLAVTVLDPPAVPWVMAACLMLGGLGNGLVISPNQTLSLAEVPLSHAGTAGAGLQTLQRLGTSVGVAVTTAVFFAAVATSHGDAAGYGQGLAVALRVTIGIVGLALVIALADALRRRRLGQRPDAAVAPR